MLPFDSCLGVCRVTQRPPCQPPTVVVMTSELHSLCFLFLSLIRGWWRGAGHHILWKAFIFLSVTWTEASWPALHTTTQLNNGIDPPNHKRTLISQSGPIFSLHRSSKRFSPEQVKWAEIKWTCGWLTSADQTLWGNRGPIIDTCTDSRKALLSVFIT